jgi:hypothetical protein
VVTPRAEEVPVAAEVAPEAAAAAAEPEVIKKGKATPEGEVAEEKPEKADKAEKREKK